MADQLSAEAQALVEEGMRLASEICLAPTIESTGDLMQSLRAHLARMADEIERGRSLTENPSRELIADAVVGAMTSGYQGAGKPPAGHWLERFWNMGRGQAEAERMAAMAAPQGEPVAWLVEWENEGKTWAQAHASELPAIDQASARKGRVTPLYTAPQAQPKLDRPARVGGAIFSTGVESRLVIDAAQRAYATAKEDAVKTPEQRRADEITRRKMWDTIHGPVGQLARALMSIEKSEEIWNRVNKRNRVNKTALTEKGIRWTFAREIEREIAQGEQP